MRQSIKIIALVFTMALYAAVDLNAQSMETPEKGFKIDMNSKTIEVNKDNNKSVEVYILRSKRFTKSKVEMSVSGRLPQGVNINFEPQKTDATETKMNVSIDKETQPGTYTLILYGYTPKLKKGVTFKLVVS